MIRRLLLGCLLAQGPVVGAHAATEAQVQAVLGEATGAFKAGQFQRALRLFRSVEADIVARGDFALYRWNVARTLEELGRWREALDAYDAYLALPDTPQNTAAGQQRRAAILQAHFGRLMITCDVRGATVSLLGEGGRTAACPADWGAVSAGKVAVEGRSASGVTRHLDVQVQPGGTARVRFEFPAQISVGGPPGAAVLIDGKAVGALPLEASAVTPGWREVVVEAPDRPRWRTRVRVVAGAHLALDASAPPPAEAEGGGRTAGWITAAAAVGLLGAGVGCYVAAASSDAAATDAANAFNANPDPARRAAVDAEIQGHVDDFETWRALSYTGLGLGVVAGGVATWLLLDGGDGVSLAPTPGGAALVGRF